GNRPAHRAEATRREGRLPAPPDTCWPDGGRSFLARCCAAMKQKQRHRSTGMIVGGVILAALAAVALATAGTAIWADQTQRDTNGYVTTSTHRYTSPGRAIATDKVTIGSAVPDWIAGKLRLAAPTSSKPVFLGIARQADVDRYLEDTSYATATEADL